MKIRVIAVGTRMPAWVKAGFADYAERMPRECGLELVEIPIAERGKNADIARLKRAEGEKILKAVPRDAQVIALDEHGDMLNTDQWAAALQRWMQQGEDVAFLVGGPDGLAPDLLDRAAHQWSLSRLTLPHGLARVLVAEQIYRAWTRVVNHPYHRA